MPNQYTTTKTCKGCGETKLNEDFYTKDKKGRRESICKVCKRKYEKEKYNPHTSSDRHLKRKYGISVLDRQKMWEEQGGVCKICGQPGDGRWKQLCVDHDHSTGKVRDLLCRRCNTVLGEVYDDPVILNKMSDYLKQHA